MGDDGDESAHDEFWDRELERYGIHLLDGLVLTAVEWVKYAADKMYQMEGPIEPEYTHFHTTWNVSKGWSKERFGFWWSR